MAQTKTAPSKASSKTRTTKAGAKPAAKKSAKAPAKSAKKPAAASKSKPKAKAGAEEVTLDRRRVAADRRAEEVAATQPVEAPKPKLERREKVNRRRQIDPTTCERDYSDAEVDFMNALDAYKRRSGRMFPTCSEVLEVIRDMGYVQLSPAELAALKANRGESSEPSIEDAAEAEALEALAESDEMFGE
ncbi:hypothetical protein [Botrimarina mediterranea]|uniref:Uncharacterized protein n=1 Tax=Botrimarina mediterranea TaxID=2528022 RepID=A0A518KCM0_9BACT|nr:hypothetical protein [Botrimarina mediterranea]QDV75534.1 hypothetical protein Spa11_37520 [Botrimarina mediterranea]QDV80168.1 hypothetical protein K2D_37920 [Planctomycetes bacterium K2D]